MYFQSEDSLEVTITDALISTSKFSPNDPVAFDVCIQVRDDAGHEDWWRGEVSQAYGKGNFADRTQAQITAATLHEIGLPNLPNGAPDFKALPSLVGNRCVATTKGSTKDGKTYYNVRYIGMGGSTRPQALSEADVAARMQRLFGAGVQQPQFQQPQFQQPMQQGLPQHGFQAQPQGQSAPQGQQPQFNPFQQMR